MSFDDLVAAELAELSAEPPRDLTTALFSDWTRVPGPVGELFVAFTDVGVSYIRTAESVSDDEELFRDRFYELFERPLRRATHAPSGLLPALRSPETALHVPVDLRVLTDFERDVLTATRRIPVGQIRPYAWVAREIGRPRAVRAVGTALGHNPVPVLIPCHRVVRSDGQLGQYVFGAPLKERLLRTEETNVDEVLNWASANILFIATGATVCYPTCARVRESTQDDRRGFRTLASALKAGYRPCELCGPGT
ncbi:methylated-DNA--[protein]-cysteine S-methyltransferase [Actinokineospora enzanensis]|uniref:methylated-DNA--[protein]-cysteine S-methyltransferase n=1 Tax=Actinokineospora enzanensis TaxID=155975 RepID=UPI0003731A88|nr:MGMT family protein [Actinokineospora enzanensis]